MDLLTFAVERYNYWIFIVLMMMGLYIVIARGNLIKKLIGLSVFQTSVFIYYISIGKIAGGTAPIYTPEDFEARTAAHGAAAAGDAAAVIYSNPLPHVLILTAIVVGVATTAVGLALVVRIREAYGTIEEDELEAADGVAEYGGAEYGPPASSP